MREWGAGCLSIHCACLSDLCRCVYTECVHITAYLLAVLTICVHAFLFPPPHPTHTHLHMHILITGWEEGGEGGREREREREREGERELERERRRERLPHTGSGNKHNSNKMSKNSHSKLGTTAVMYRLLLRPIEETGRKRWIYYHR